MLDDECLSAPGEGRIKISSKVVEFLLLGGGGIGIRPDQREIVAIHHAVSRDHDGLERHVEHLLEGSSLGQFSEARGISSRPHLRAAIGIGAAEVRRHVKKDRRSTQIYNLLRALKQEVAASKSISAVGVRDARLERQRHQLIVAGDS
jgi:hypothetical protein